MNMESLYEYGSRAGFWRLHRLFTQRNITATVFAVGLALEKHPEAAKAMVNDCFALFHFLFALWTLFLILKENKL
jgi:allantoinase